MLPCGKAGVGDDWDARSMVGYARGVMSSSESSDMIWMSGKEVLRDSGVLVNSSDVDRCGDCERGDERGETAYPRLEAWGASGRGS